MTPWQEYYFKTINSDGYGYRFDFNKLFSDPYLIVKTHEFSNKIKENKKEENKKEENKKEENKMQDKFDQILTLRNKKQELEKQLSNFLLEISRDERDLKEIQKTIDNYNKHMNLMKESYVKTSQMLSEVDQKLKEVNK